MTPNGNKKRRLQATVATTAARAGTVTAAKAADDGSSGASKRRKRATIATLAAGDGSNGSSERRQRAATATVMAAGQSLNDKLSRQSAFGAYFESLALNQQPPPEPHTTILLSMIDIEQLLSEWDTAAEPPQLEAECGGRSKTITAMGKRRVKREMVMMPCGTLVKYRIMLQPLAALISTL
ncbi:hypothetical protein DVH05_025209 [Phytophthora capsici]|nr:hypothetical protein DVH05_025209 [Phytophthora capsici]